MNIHLAEGTEEALDGFVTPRLRLSIRLHHARRRWRYPEVRIWRLRIGWIRSGPFPARLTEREWFRRP